jgi:arabinogalactan endo-1,4-beta-galactosidase
LDIAELCAYFIDWQKAFELRNELMQILKGTGIDWCRMRLMSKLYMEQCDWTKVWQQVRRWEAEFDKDAACH